MDAVAGHRSGWSKNNNELGPDRTPAHPRQKTLAVKRADGEPLSRVDIQYDLLAAIFDDERAVFTDPFLPNDNTFHKSTFRNLYVNAILHSAKCTKGLREKMRSNPRYGTDFAMLSLLANVGRISTGMAFFPELRTNARTWHPIPCLQTNEESLQDAPRIKILLRACTLPTDLQGESPMDILMRSRSGQIPSTTAPNLIFSLAEHNLSLSNFLPSTSHAANPLPTLEFPSLFYPTTPYTSLSRAQTFLHLIYYYLEGSSPSSNPFLPRLDHLPTYPSQENQDQPGDADLAERLRAKRRAFLDGGSAARAEEHVRKVGRPRMTKTERERRNEIERGRKVDKQKIGEVMEREGMKGVLVLEKAPGGSGHAGPSTSASAARSATVNVPGPDLVRSAMEPTNRGERHFSSQGGPVQEHDTITDAYSYYQHPHIDQARARTQNQRRRHYPSPQPHAELPVLTKSRLPPPYTKTPLSRVRQDRERARAAAAAAAGIHVSPPPPPFEPGGGLEGSYYDLGLDARWAEVEGRSPRSHKKGKKRSMSSGFVDLRHYNPNTRSFQSARQREREREQEPPREINPPLRHYNPNTGLFSSSAPDRVDSDPPLNIRIQDDRLSTFGAGYGYGSGAGYEPERSPSPFFERDDNFNSTPRSSSSPDAIQTQHHHPHPHQSQHPHSYPNQSQTVSHSNLNFAYPRYHPTPSHSFRTHAASSRGPTSFVQSANIANLANGHGHGGRLPRLRRLSLDSDDYDYDYEQVDGIRKRSMLQHAWYTVCTTDALADSDDETHTDPHARLEITRRLRVIDKIRSQAPSPYPVDARGREFLERMHEDDDMDMEY